MMRNSLTMPKEEVDALIAEGNNMLFVSKSNRMKIYM